MTLYAKTLKELGCINDADCETCKNRLKHIVGKCLIIDDNVDMYGSDITKLPPYLEVRGWLDLGGCTSLTRLPDGLKVGDWLDLRSCMRLNELPVSLEVGTNIYADKDQLKKVPKHLKDKVINIYW